MHGDRGWIVESQYYVPNEIWSWGEEAYEIMKKYLDIRLDMKDYITHIYNEASRTGVPLLRAMHLEFPDDEKCWEYTEEYMFGPKYLVAPVLYSGMRERNVYLPKGKWRDINTNICYTGECDIVVPTPIDYIPVFEKLE
jgi:alpha-D-xyloside xylohydrolase